MFSVWLSIGCTVLWSQPKEARILAETAIGPILPDVMYRAAVCPTGAVVIHNGIGDVMIVSRDGAILARRAGAVIQDGTASACDDPNTLFVAAKGSIYRYEMSPAWELTLKESFAVSGITLRLALDRESLYLLGYARIDGTPVLIRRHRRSIGERSTGICPKGPFCRSSAVGEPCIFRQTPSSFTFSTRPAGT
jgi:hypothetical protein